MKEDEAREKWCPFVRCSSNSGGINRDGQAGHEYPQYLCIGSDCMMWEPEYKEIAEPMLSDEIVDKSIKRDEWHRKNSTMEWVRFEPTDSGDCGLKQNTMVEECRYPGG